FDRYLDHAFVLSVTESGRFAGRAARYDSIDAALDLPLDVLAQGTLVDRTVAKGCDDRGQRTVEHRQGLLCDYRLDRVAAELDSAAKDFNCVAGHEHAIGAVALLAPFDLEIAAAKFHRRASLGAPVEHGRHQRRTCAGAAGPGLARATLPHSHFEMVRRNRQDEFGIDAARK